MVSRRISHELVFCNELLGLKDWRIVGDLAESCGAKQITVRISESHRPLPLYRLLGERKTRDI